ncbi:MAG: hypothetical protein AAFS06_20650 [Cyanobacteria bacterium J06631_12]
MIGAIVTGYVKRSIQVMDLSRVGDKSRYILGWDNTSKIKALEAELTQIEQQLDKVAARIRQIEKQQGQQRSRETWLQDFILQLLKGR